MPKHRLPLIGILLSKREPPLSEQEPPTALHVMYFLAHWCHFIDNLVEIANEGLDPVTEPLGVCRGCGKDIEALTNIQGYGEKLFTQSPRRYPWFDPTVLRQFQSLVLRWSTGDSTSTLWARILETFPDVRFSVAQLRRACEIDTCPDCRAEYLATVGEEFSTSRNPVILEMIAVLIKNEAKEPLETGSKSNRRIADSPKQRNTPRWLTVSEAATAADTHRGTISVAVNGGKLKSNGKIGRARRVDAIDLARWKLVRAKRPEPVESDEQVERLARRAGLN